MPPLQLRAGIKLLALVVALCSILFTPAVDRDLRIVAGLAQIRSSVFDLLRNYEDQTPFLMLCILRRIGGRQSFLEPVAVGVAKL